MQPCRQSVLFSKRLAIALLAALALALGVSTAAHAATRGDFTTIAHRGYHAYTTENSIAALNATARAGSTAMQTDVRLYAPSEVHGRADQVRLFPQNVTAQVVDNFNAAGVKVASRENEDPNLSQAVLDAGAARSLVSDDAPALVAWMANHPQ